MKTHLSDSIPNRHLLQLRLSLLLNILRQQHDPNLLNLLKPRMRLLVRVDEMLDLGHGELSNSKETLPGGDLVSERPTNLGRGERNTTVVELEQTGKVDKVTLGSLGSEETGEKKNGVAQS